MTIQDLKYITPLDIQSASFNVLSAEMYDEAKRFNQHMYDMQVRRQHFMRDLWKILTLNIIVFAVAIPTALSDYTSLVFRLTGGKGLFLSSTGGNIILTYLPAVLYAAALLYFIFIRKIYNWKLMLILSLLPIPTNYAFAVLIIGNTFFAKKMNDTDNEIKDEVGYPSFAELHLSFIRDEEYAEEGDMDEFEDGSRSDDLESERRENPYDKYRTRYQTEGGGYLRDSDINENNIAEENNYG